MAKLNKSNLKKIDLEDIILKDNVRKVYNNILELAGSIKREGLLQPVVVAINEDGEYELTAGYRRYYAHKYLVEHGEPFNQIQAIVRQGDFEIIQLIENIHRDDLSPTELEQGLKRMIDSGMSQVDIAERLNKSKSWVCDGLKANEVRTTVESQGVSTEGISTSAISKMRKIPEDDLKIVVNGGTVAAVKDVIADRKIKEVDPFKGFKKEVVKLKEDYDLHFIVDMLKEIY
jgi:ParB/RepB/Spo0J family partition protein